MTRIVLDVAMSKRLENVVDYAELCDENGTTIGHFIPAVDAQLYRQVEIPFTQAELATAEREEAISTTEVLRHLHGLNV